MTSVGTNSDRAITGKRILVVEDIKDLRETFTGNIREYLPGNDVDGTDSRHGAMELLRRRTYHAAMLDIMLVEDMRDTGGLVVLDQIRAMNEGTLVVMLSGSQEIDNCIHALRSRICVDYIHKAELTSPQVYIAPIQSALVDAQIPIHGNFGSLTAHLAHPTPAVSWEFSAIQTLGEGGFQLLTDSLAQAFSRLLPVLRRKNCSSGLFAARETSMLHGQFWSKALGQPVWVAISTSPAPFPPPVSTEPAPLSEGHIGNARYEVRLLRDVSRDDFVETIWE